MRTVGVVGAGTIGRGVAQVVAEAGREVVLVDVSPAVLEEARDEIRRGLRMRSLVGGLRPGGGGGETPAVPAEEVLSRISFESDYGGLAAAGVIVENVSEDLAEKERAQREIAAVCRADALVACNTSAIPVATLAQWNPEPGRVIGMHFMNPVPLKPTVELILGPETTDAARAAAEEFLASIGKRAIVVRDSPGFVSNRVLMAMVNDASRIVDEGIASAADVDAVFRECFGHPMGPLETADLIGIDTVVRSLEILRGYWDDVRFETAPSLRRLVEAGHLGRKTGRGFFAYGGGDDVR